MGRTIGHRLIPPLPTHTHTQFFYWMMLCITFAHFGLNHSNDSPDVTWNLVIWRWDSDVLITGLWCCFWCDVFCELGRVMDHGLTTCEPTGLLFPSPQSSGVSFVKNVCCGCTCNWKQKKVFLSPLLLPEFCWRESTLFISRWGPGCCNF